MPAATRLTRSFVFVREDIDRKEQRLHCQILCFWRTSSFSELLLTSSGYSPSFGRSFSTLHSNTTSQGVPSGMSVEQKLGRACQLFNYSIEAWRRTVGGGHQHAGSWRCVAVALRASSGWTCKTVRANQALLKHQVKQHVEQDETL